MHGAIPSTPALVSSILPQSSSDLDTDQGDIIDEILKQVAQSVNQMLLKTSTGNPTSSLTQNDPHMTIMQTDRHSTTQTQVMFIHKQIHSQFILMNQPHLKHHYKSKYKFQKSQTNHNVHILHSPTLQNKIL